MRRALAVLLLISGWIAPLAVPHAGGDDTLCIPASSLGGGANTRFDAVGVQKAPDHCAICHSVRAFRSTAIEGGFVLVGLSAGDLLAAFENSVHVTSALVRLPARAPPLV